MKYYLFLSLAFLYLIPSHCNTIGKSNNTSKFKWTQTKLHCKRFKCPPVEDLVCVRMRSKKIGSKTKDIYMLLLNKCEMEYMKCHQDYQAAEVPMKNCGNHDKLRHSGKRRKRSVRQGFRKPIKRDSSGLDENTNFDGVDREPPSEDMNNDEENKPDERVSERAPENENNAEGNHGQANIYEINNVGKEKESAVKPNDKDEAVERLDELTEVGKDTDDPSLKADDQTDNFQEDKENQAEEDQVVDYKTDDGDTDNKDHAYEMGTTDTQPTDYPIDHGGDKNEVVDHGVTDNYDLNEANEGVDFEEYDKDCPATCPAREVMICARCRDGIYRTFMSGCHLRMFNCNHPDEQSELVSRLPCVLSAPYLAEVASPKGRVAEPGDVDKVMKFIRCREKAELGRDDPKCNIYNDDRKKNQRRN